ncbi:MAG: hypothetical protein ABF254_14660 [Octadecabacter sp.]
MRWSFLIVALWASPALASCPDPDLGGASYAAVGPDLIVPKNWDVRAVGQHPAPCEDWAEIGIAAGNLDGFLPAAPTAVFELDEMGPHILMVMARAECNPVLAVRSGDGLWHFGQTANGREEVTLWGAPKGALQVWVGAATREGCDGTVTLETFDR